MIAVVVSASALGSALAILRWLRVAQREHYIPGSATRFAVRWWFRRPPNPLLVALAVASTIVAGWLWPAGLLVTVVVGGAPLGLSLKGRTSPLRWTPRLRRLAATSAVIEIIALAAAALSVAVSVAAPVSALLVPLWVDLALFMMVPVERRLSRRYVRQAEDKLRRAAPRVVAITGSYGKTSSKEHVRDLVAGTFEVVASPASFNNRLGLAKAINDALSPGVEVFVAEMGTFAKGEIAELCSWIKPSVSVLTAVGPVHLERFGSLEAIAEAKAEIFADAPNAVINADDERVVRVAPRPDAGVEVTRCSAHDAGADVSVREGPAGLDVSVAGKFVGTAPPGLFAINVACATGAALALGVPAEAIGRRLARLGPPAHRAQVSEAPNGVVVIDDTYNSNPEGAAAALGLVARMADGASCRVVVTPGMIELGRTQKEENTSFGAAAAKVATHVVVVGHTNRPALVAGARRGEAEVVVVADRDEASRYVRTILSSGDLVLYENDLPDHHP